MPIENRSLTPGTTLVARYRKEPVSCSVEANEDGKLVYVLADGRRFTSPSAAASAITSSTQNGWRFWSLQGEAAASEPTPRKQPRASKPRAAKGLISRLKKQDGAGEGMVRYFCSSCMDAFEAPAGEPPATCPQGHGPDLSEPA